MALLCVMTGVFTLSHCGWTQITVDPLGFAVYAEAEDTLTTEFTLHNGGENEVVYDLRLRGGNNNVQRQGGPRRDDPGDEIQVVQLQHPGALGIARDFENDIMWVTHTIQENGAVVNGFLTGYEWDGREIGDVVADIRPQRFPIGGTYHDGILYTTPWISTIIMRYDLEGNMLDDINLNAMNPMGFCIDPETEYLYVMLVTAVNIIVLDINDNFNQVATIASILGRAGDGDFRSRLCWVPEHDEGHLWLSYQFRAYQLNIDEEWGFQVIQDFPIDNDVRSFGIGHDGVNLWTGNAYTNEISIRDDGIVEPNWLTLTPLTGAVAAGEDAVISALVIPEGLDQGVYDLIVEARFDDENLPIVQMAIVLSFESPVADINGTVVEPGSDDPIPDIHVSLGEYLISRWTDENGAFSMENLPLGNYRLVVSAPDYLPITENVELGENGLNLRIELFHSEFTLSRDRIETELSPDTDTHIQFSASNDGNGPCTYSIDRRLPGDANAAPWDVRTEINDGEILDDDRIEGVAFAEGSFYFAGANGDNPNTIYITDINGERTGLFVQPGESRYGMKDLEWDGQLLWGSGEQRVFGFDTEGNIEHEFQGPFNPNTCIAYDDDRDVLWISGTTTDIASYTRDGQPTGVRLNRRGLRMYGHAYWPDDPDGFPLYIVNSPSAGVIRVHKMNPANGDTMLARNLIPPEGASAGGAVITNTFDVYSWVLMVSNNIPTDNGGDKTLIYQLDARRDWFLVEPIQGVIQAGNSQQFDLHLNAADLPAALFEGELLFSHDGIGSSNILPISLNVVDGPVVAERVMPLNVGWNLISANVQPDPNNMIEITQGLVDAGVLDLVKDDRGRFYRPASQFSNLDPWLVSEGYMFKVSEAAELAVEGIAVAADEPIALSMGWQAVSYYPRVRINAITALSGIREVLIIAKDGLGNFYLPAYGFSNMGEMREGFGYQIRVSEAAQLVYQMGQQLASQSSTRYVSVYEQPGRYTPHPATGVNMSLLVKSDLVDGTDIGVYANDVLVGCGVFSSGLAGISICGDDPSTAVIDGACKGDPLTIRIRDDAGERAGKASLLQGEMNYKTDDFAVITMEAELIPSVFGLTGVYPNPFNSRLTASFGMPVSEMIEAGIYDLSGREVLHLTSEVMPAGNHRLAISGEKLSSGVYILQLVSAGKRSQMKIALVK